MTKNAILALGAPLSLILVTICFGFNSSVLDDRACQSLDDIVCRLDSLSDYTIHLGGHTDNVGPDSYNDLLSEERAIAVKNYLVSKNIDSTKIAVDFYGEHKPIVPNTSEASRALNRRVEVTISGQVNRIPPPLAPSGQPVRDTTTLQKQNSKITLSAEEKFTAEKEFKKKRSGRRLVWTGWRTGFHWSTSGR